MKKNRYFVRMIRVMAMTLALFTGAGGAWCTPAGMLTAYAKGMEKPTLNAAVSDGVLSIQAQSGDSVIQKMVVNGYEFDDIWNGTLNIRLQQFDASYPEFTIQAADQDGNGDSGTELPVSAVPTDPGSATAKVTEYENNGQGKEFYTIQTASEKTFYLIVDRDGENENVYFLTEISENDLLNTTSGNSETLPKNSAALESAIPISDGANSNYLSSDTEGTEETTADEPAEPEKETSEEQQPVIGYLVMGAVALVAVGAGYYLKVVRKKKEEFLDEDEDDEEEELYEEEETDDSEDDFFQENDVDSADDIEETGEDE